MCVCCVYINFNWYIYIYINLFIYLFNLFIYLFIYLHLYIYIYIYASSENVYLYQHNKETSNYPPSNPSVPQQLQCTSREVNFGRASSDCFGAEGGRRILEQCQPWKKWQDWFGATKSMLWTLSQRAWTFNPELRFRNLVISSHSLNHFISPTNSGEKEPGDQSATADYICWRSWEGTTDTHVRGGSWRSLQGPQNTHC